MDFTGDCRATSRHPAEAKIRRTSPQTFTLRRQSRSAATGAEDASRRSPRARVFPEERVRRPVIGGRLRRRNRPQNFPSIFPCYFCAGAEFECGRPVTHKPAAPSSIPNWGSDLRKRRRAGRRCEIIPVRRISTPGSSENEWRRGQSGTNCAQLPRGLWSRRVGHDRRRPRTATFN